MRARAFGADVQLYRDVLDVSIRTLSSDPGEKEVIQLIALMKSALALSSYSCEGVWVDRDRLALERDPTFE